MLYLKNKRRGLLMNTVWSSFIQGINTLYFSRKLRFDDIFKSQYKSLFNIDESEPLKILELGCGPGSFAEALRRWYPNAEITAIDRDSAFIDFARKNIKNITFKECCIEKLPFKDNFFDITISNTVAEHIKPSDFYFEQKRVLKQSGACIVLSARKGITVIADCFSQKKYTENLSKKFDKYNDMIKKFNICKYPMSEAEIPKNMAEYEFSDISTGYAVIDLTPDNPKYSSEFANSIINANRLTELDGCEHMINLFPGELDKEEIENFKRAINSEYDTRIHLYETGEKQWDTNVSLTMITKGIKKTNC